MTIESLSRDGSKNYLLQNELLRQHRLSLRQTFASVGTLVVYLVATQDTFISRFFFFNFVPWLYVALLFSHHYLPSFLARGIFKSERADKTLLIGSCDKAKHLRGWLRRKGGDRLAHGRFVVRRRYRKHRRRHPGARNAGRR
jgi:hypothetical protein